MKYALERLLNNYLALRDPEEDFSDFVDRHTDDELASMMQVEFAEGVEMPPPQTAPADVEG
ncbi:MAG: hypothetical protein ACUVTY_07720 [Armatimonadota bacterium]